MQYSYTAEIERLERLIEPHLHPDLYFVNIGANDGVLNDPIYPLARRWGWRGVCVEPIPEVFERLRANYASLPQVTLVNAAITTGTRTMWRVAPGSGSASFLVEQLASLDRERLEETLRRLREAADSVGTQPHYHPDHPPMTHGGTHDGPALARDVEIAEVPVTCIEFDALASQCSIERIDVLNIDCEGSDHEVLCAVDLERFRPNLVIVETVDMTEDQRDDTHRRLSTCGLRPAGSFGLFSRVYVRPADR